MTQGVGLQGHAGATPQRAHHLSSPTQYLLLLQLQFWFVVPGVVIGHPLANFCDRRVLRAFPHRVEQCINALAFAVASHFAGNPFVHKHFAEEVLAFVAGLGIAIALSFPPAGAAGASLHTTHSHGLRIFYCVHLCSCGIGVM